MCERKDGAVGGSSQARHLCLSVVVMYRGSNRSKRAWVGEGRSWAKLCADPVPETRSKGVGFRCSRHDPGAIVDFKKEFCCPGSRSKMDRPIAIQGSRRVQLGGEG